MFRKLHLMLCVLGFHKKKLYVGGYRCEYCGKYVGGCVPEDMRVKGCGRKKKQAPAPVAQYDDEEQLEMFI